MKFCEKCGKEIMDEAVVCPNCGCSVKKEDEAPKVIEVPKQARTASLLGILSVVIFAPLGIPAIILANKSKEKTGGVMCKQAKTGFWCGIVGLCCWALGIIIMLGGM